jgi:hypothetical protein
MLSSTSGNTQLLLYSSHSQRAYQILREQHSIPLAPSDSAGSGPGGSGGSEEKVYEEWLEVNLKGGLPAELQAKGIVAIMLKNNVAVMVFEGGVVVSLKVEDLVDELL